MIYSPVCIFLVLDKNEDYINFNKQLNVDTFIDDKNKHFDFSPVELETWKLSENLIDKQNAFNYNWQTQDFQYAPLFINYAKNNKNSRFRYMNKIAYGE